ncbi:type II toxin-antitoxin system RelE/ParE family toxin [Moorena producens JHB]|uniref:Type II toxin-antitoxin system RelE/ParE family toxin n=1 Tax=Moorena producens (strain JHB) TaxID=1454205 RepID=A0A1D9GAJ8_MOOP1|nr:type II toxin-antitoxin system RelE/ParE family toxin [Moorena producens]AOY84571.2 type II toxin-antitoxin system RelE/ParE family toxin [Moorena producens JHB]
MPNFNMGDELLKTVIWVGPSKNELLRFTEDVIDEVGYILYRVQKNQNHPHIKPLKELNGVFEIVSDYKTDPYRTVYAVKLGNTIYVLHAFKKKSKTGIKTPKQTMDLIKERLKQAQEIAKQQD